MADNDDAKPSNAESESKSEAMPTPVTMQPPRRSLRARFRNKKVWIPAAVIVVLAALAAVPFTRFALAGTVLKQTFKVKVLDMDTKQPVTSAQVMLDGTTVKTDNQGQAALKVKVGPATLAVSKKYYQSATQKVTVPILKQEQTVQLSIKATGRQVPVSVTNLISGQSLANVKISASGTEATTDGSGKATLVLPANQQTVSATLSTNGYNNAQVSVKVTESAVKENQFTLTPSGRFYFLSNRDGTIDVVKTNLDGSDRQVALAGTGKEDGSTQLLHTSDWKYLALYSKRDGGTNPKLFLIDTSSDHVSVMVDPGTNGLSLIGWSGHRFVYDSTNTAMNTKQAGREVIKSYNADSGQTATLDQNQIDQRTTNNNGNMMTIYESFQNFNLVGNQLVYSTRWASADNIDIYWYYALTPLTRKQDTIRSVGVDGQGKKDWKGYDTTYNNYINTRIFEPTSVEFIVTVTGGYDFYEFHDGSLSTIQSSDQAFYASAPYKVASPSGNQTVWTELRDGQTVVFVGDSRGGNAKQVATTTGASAFGWFTDNYALLSKDSAVYILYPGAANSTPIKVTDIYGYGYDR